MPDAQTNSEQINEYLRAFLQEHTTALKKFLCVYVLRMGLAKGEDVRLVADEAFQDTVLEVLRYGERFMDIAQPRSWFLAVAVNVLKRKRASFARRYRFEILISDLVAETDLPGETDFLEQITISSSLGPEQTFESHEQVREMLALVSPEDAEILRLALLYELDSQGLADYLGVNIGTARVRLHRALRRLRKAWKKQQESSRRERA